jgi:predicted unusual protein kinase regulating ubiquinone biosynthesis (AarF/ABC1/UbiB family)
MSRKPVASSRVPQSRLGRLARLGLAAGELALGGAVQGLRRLGQGADASMPRFSAATARRLAERLATLRGAAMKLGQLISLEGDGLLPPELAAALEMLRSQAAPMPGQQLRRALGRAYGSGGGALPNSMRRRSPPRRSARCIGCGRTMAAIWR